MLDLNSPFEIIKAKSSLFLAFIKSHVFVLQADIYLYTLITYLANLTSTMSHNHDFKFSNEILMYHVQKKKKNELVLESVTFSQQSDLKNILKRKSLEKALLKVFFPL